MKKILIAIIPILIFSVMVSCNADKYEKGSFDETSFKSEYLNLKFDLPEGFIMAGEEEINEMMGLGFDTLEIDKKMVNYAKLTTVTEMMALAPSGDPNVIVMVERLLFSNLSIEQYIDNVKKTLSNLPNIDYKFGDISTTEVANQSYTQFRATTDVLGQDINQDYLVRKSGNRMVCIVTTSTTETEEELQILMQGFSYYE